MYLSFHVTYILGNHIEKEKQKNKKIEFVSINQITKIDTDIKKLIDIPSLRLAVAARV